MSPTERIVALEADVAKLQWQMAQLLVRLDKAEGKRPETVQGFKVVRTEAVDEPLFVNVNHLLAP